MHNNENKPIDRAYIDTFMDAFRPDAPSLTHQSFKDECDINRIMERYAETGFLIDPNIIPNREPLFDDFYAAHDFYAAQNILAESMSRFESLPVSIRERFRNNPAELLQFLDNDANRAEAVALGLVSAPINPDSNGPSFGQSENQNNGA